jgi:class 3 adenylate cyclase
MTTAPMRRRNAASFPWLRAAAFAGVTYLACSALGFYPAAVPPVIAIVTGVLGLLAPGIGVLLAVVAIGVPLAAGDIVAGALFLVLGFGCIQYLSDSQGRAFLVISLAFAATVLRAEWGVAVLAGYLLGASEGAVAAFVACLLIQGTGLLLGARSLGTLAIGGTARIVDLTALAKLEDPLKFAWFLPALNRADPAALLAAVTSAKHIGLLALQPLLWAGAAATAGLLRRPAGDPRRRVMALAAAAAGTALLAALSIGASAALAGPLSVASLAVAGGVSLVVALVGVAASEWVFTPEQPVAAKSSADSDDADVDELLRMISSAEEELASKHTVVQTVLITDMKSFSRLTQELGSTETAKLVQRHRDLLLPVIGRHGGKGKPTGGDGLLAAFAAPADALAAAVEMQQALDGYNSSRPGEEAVLVRAGVASGEVVLDNGGKPFLGDALNLAARVMGLADGGQVFTTGLDAAAAGDLPFGSKDHGGFRLKNIALPVDIVEVFWAVGQHAHAPDQEGDSGQT